MNRLKISQTCPCGGLSYDKCCKQFHLQVTLANTAEQLMRSRYSAFALKNESYLLKTWHPSTRPIPPLFSAIETQKWVELRIKNTSISTQNEAYVEFIAIYKVDGKAHRLHENSKFIKENDQWFYLNGTFPN